MLGYHDVPNCSFDLWSPNPTRWGYNAIENRAFSPYAKHTQEIDDLVEMIAAGGTSFELDDEFSEADIQELKRKLAARGISADISFSDI